MKVYYDPKHDVMYIEFSNKNAVDTIEVEEGILIDYGENKEIVGIEIIDASRRLKADLREITIRLEQS
ncbi:DUF2283 domain-containing protein [Archaeoglobus sp.]